jgi:tetratricopeptide (TPR) repeat protein
MEVAMSFPHDDCTLQRIRKFAAAVALGALVAGCASGGTARVAYSPEAFVVAARAQAPQMAREDLVVPFLVTPEMVERAEYFTAGSTSEFEKADRLMKSLTDPNGFGLSYDAVATSTPDETFAQGHGNCLALTSMFIGLARQIGLIAYYVDASDRVNELRRSEELIVDSGHIAGGVRTERGYTLVDYDGHVSRYRTFRIIDDITALAHFYNNRGYETIYDAQQSGDPVPWEQIMHDFQLATMVRPDFTRAHNNLGVAYTRLGDLDAAEDAYRHAIASDDEGDAAYYNLGNLYIRRGDYRAALAAYDEALARRKRNPYLHYHRGVAQYRLGELSAAEESFKRAIALEQGYIEPRSLLAQVYYQQGRVEEAEAVRAAVQLILRGRQER